MVVLQSKGNTAHTVINAAQSQADGLAKVKLVAKRNLVGRALQSAQ